MRKSKNIMIGDKSLEQILEEHKHWLLEDCEGWRDMQANLRNANLRNADLRNAKNAPFVPYACPDFGIFIGFKKAIGVYEEQAIKVLVMLEIPEDAKRLSATGRKCRCDKAKVLRITDLEETVELTEAYSGHDNNFYYRVGEMVSVDDFDEDRWNECSTGIHFFINKQEAINY